MATAFVISRDRLASFIKDPDTIRRFEKLFQEVAVDNPETIAIIFRRLQELSVDLGTALSDGVSTQDSLEYLSRLVEVAVTNQHQAMPSSFPIDYIDFSHNAPFSERTGRIGWNPNDDTLNLYHSDGVTQQIGQETYSRIQNNTGITIPNGSALGINPATNSYVLYIADGTLSSLNIVGVTTQDIPNGAMGRITVWGNVRDLDTTGTPYGETWTAGDVLYVSTTIAGGFTNSKPTAPNLSIPIAQVRVVSSTVGEIAIRPTPEQQLYYGQITKTTDQTPAAANTAYGITWPAVSIGNGISVGVPNTRVVAANAGLYKFSASFQLTSGSASVKNVWFWFRKNGVDIANSSIVTSLDSGSAIRTPSRSLLISLAAGDYVEVMWASNDTNVTLDAIAATAFAPASPSATLTVNQEQQ